jgi:hypothetical protein
MMMSGEALCFAPEPTKHIYTDEKVTSLHSSLPVLALVLVSIAAGASSTSTLYLSLTN